MSQIRLAEEKPRLRLGARQRLLSMDARSALWGYFFIAPSLLMFVIFSLYPMFDSVVLSFQRFTLTGRAWLGLSNYQTLLSDPDFPVVLKNTLLYTLLIVPFGVVLSLGLSALIYRLPTARTDLLQIGLLPAGGYFRRRPEPHLALPLRSRLRSLELLARPDRAAAGALAG